MGYLHKYSCKHFCGLHQTRVRLNIPKLEVLKGFDEDLKDIGGMFEGDKPLSVFGINNLISMRIC